MGDRFQLAAPLRDKRVWAALLLAGGLLTGLLLWAARSYQRAQALNLLNEFAPFANPALELAFPRLVLETEVSRSLLQPGVDRGFWTLHSRGGAPPAWEVRLTSEGQRWFSTVGTQIVATFKLGTREVTRVLELNEIYPTRKARYLYRWTGFQPASAVLGDGRPEEGKQYEGEALFHHENGQWRVMHWTAVDSDRVVEAFRGLQSAER
jgi:hypothetical protein